MPCRLPDCSVVELSAGPDECAAGESVSWEASEVLALTAALRFFFLSFFFWFFVRLWVLWVLWLGVCWWPCVAPLASASVTLCVGLQAFQAVETLLRCACT